MELRDIAIILGLFLIALVIRAAGVPDVCMYVDEQTYWYHTNLILANNFVPVEQVFKYTNPFLSYVMAGVTLLFNGELNTLRMVSVIFGSLTVSFLYLFGKTLYDRKTGLLSAFLLCFSAFHCIYSRLIYLEAFAMFFITAFFYFFWLSQSKQKIRYACLAGMMMGLAIDAKYISLFLVPAVLAYVLWTGRFNFKALLDKQIILIFTFAFLFFLPLLAGLYYTGLGLYPFQYQAIQRFEKVNIAGIAIHQLSPIELFVGAIEDFSDLLARGAAMLPWEAIFKLSVILLFIIVSLSYLPALLNAEKKDCLLIIPYISFFAFLYIGCSTHYYYLIYLFPLYFVMLSHLTIKSLKRLKNYKRSPKKIPWIFIILLVTIMLFSYLVSGITSPYWDTGDHVGIQDGLSYIKNDFISCKNEKHLVIGSLMTAGSVDYLIHLNKLNASVQPLFELTSKYAGKKYRVSLNMINMLKPNYILISANNYNFYFKKQYREELLKDYKLVFQSQPTSNLDSSPKTKPYNYLVFKRMHVEEEERDKRLLSKIPKEYSAEICSDVFDRTTPEVMEIGKVYTALVQIRNTGTSRACFEVRVHSDRYTLFIEPPNEIITLDSGEYHLFKFRMVPLTECKEKVLIEVDLYKCYEVDGTCKTLKMDTFSDRVYIVKK